VLPHVLWGGMPSDSGVPDGLEEFLSVVTGEIESVLGDSLIALYLGGSAAGQRFIDGRSDLDLVAVVGETLDLGVKSQLVRRLWSVLPPEQARGVETRVVTIADLPGGRCFELLVSTHPGEPVTADRGQDPSVMLELAHLRDASTALLGPPAETLVPDYERSAVLTAMAEGLEERIDADPETYSVLTAARSLAYMETGDLVSKIEGAQWARENGRDSEILDRAIATQRGELPERPLTARGRRFVTEVVAALRVGA